MSERPSDDDLNNAIRAYTNPELTEARVIARLIRDGKPIPCGKGPADPYILALDSEVDRLRRDLADAVEREKRLREAARGLLHFTAGTETKHYDMVAKKPCICGTCEHSAKLRAALATDAAKDGGRA